MPARIVAAPDSGLLVVHDAAVTLPAVDQDGIAALERDAVAGKLFFLASEDPIRFRVDVYIGETPPPELDDNFQALGGSFLLDLPSGRLVVRGLPSAPASSGDVPIVLPNGAYVLTVMGRRAFDGRRHEREIVALVGDADWRFFKRTTWLGLLGCLPTILALGSLFFAIQRGHWRFFVLVALPLFVLAWAPYVFLRNSGRYRAMQRRMNEHEAEKPGFVIKLAATERTTALSGGFVKV
jgi:hypothetical protein